MTPTLSVVESIWNMPTWTLDCNLATLSMQTEPPLEILVVNASSDPAFFEKIEAVCAKYPLVRMVSAPMPTFNLSRNTNVGIRAAQGDYVMLTCIDQIFSEKVLAEVYRVMAPGRVVQSHRAELVHPYEGDVNDITRTWDALMAKAIQPTKGGHGTLVCIQKEWLEKVHGLDETRTPYNYCDSDLSSRAALDGLETGWVRWDVAQVIHFYHERNTALYYGLGGKLPDNSLPIIRNPDGWGL